MIVSNKQEVIDSKEKIISEIKSGRVFIYPTDTIYGLGCDATNEASVQKIREIKNREEKPFLVIAPNKNWITNNCEVPDISKLDLLQGPYSLILKLKNNKVLAENVSNGKTVGVRIPSNWFSEIISEAQVPFVTTSVNLSGENHMQKIEDISKDILDQVDYVIYDGPIFGKPSTKLDLTGWNNPFY